MSAIPYSHTSTIRVAVGVLVSITKRLSRPTMDADLELQIIASIREALSFTFIGATIGTMFVSPLIHPELHADFYSRSIRDHSTPDICLL